MNVSVVIPVYNERENLHPLLDQLRTVFDSQPWDCEVIFVDDGSSDGTAGVLGRLQASDPRVRVVTLRRNFGQTPALAVGLDRARNDCIVTMDADLQNLPSDIPRLVAKLEEGHDVVVGWRRDRRDPWLSRRLPSLVANWILSRTMGLAIHDSGCTLKAIRADVVRRLPLYGEMHRFIPALSLGAGARVTEIPVGHRERAFGTSKYGIGRTFGVVLDMLTLKVLIEFSSRPLHWFGLTGMITLLLSGALFLTSIAEGPRGLVGTTPSVLLFLLGVSFVLMGLLAELCVKASGHFRRAILDTIVGSSR